jgi:RimJ/RimL family protein N-acetyltransferase
MKPPVLHSPRLRLVAFDETHLSARYVGWLNDPITMRYSENRHRRHDLASCRDYLRSFDNSAHFFWAALREADGLHIGNLTAYVDVSNRIADIGILIGERSCWNQGFGTEAWATAMCFLLRDCRMRKVEGGAMEANRSMIAIFGRTGMELEGRRVGHFLLDGQSTDMVLYGRFADA